MSRERHRIALLVGGATVVLAIVLGLRPVSAQSILAGYVLALAAIALASAVRVLATGDLHVSELEYALTRKPEPPLRPPELVRVEREITLGATSAGHFHRRLLPLLRDAAEARLGFELARRPDAARERLGADAWELLRPDLHEPDDRTAPGTPIRRIRTVVETLERL